jgi:hypothetical protein
MLERHHDVVKAAFVFRDPDSDELAIEAGIGITADGLAGPVPDRRRGSSGASCRARKPIVVPDVTREPLFLNRAGPTPEPAGDGDELRLARRSSMAARPSVRSASSSSCRQDRELRGARAVPRDRRGMTAQAVKADRIRRVGAAAAARREHAISGSS